VIKVEGFTRMDSARGSVLPENDPSGDWWNRTAYFLPRNLGKRSLALDLTKPEGVDLVRRLVPLADVLIESFTPRVMRNLGLEYPKLRALKDDLIMVSLSGYGQTGPWADYAAFGYGLDPACGIAWLNGYPGGPPIRTHLPFNDPLAGVVGAGAVLTALFHHRRTGRGQYIDLSQHEAGIPLVGAALMAFAINGPADPWLERLGSGSPRMAPHGCYPCRGWDQWLAIACRDETEWLALCAAAGHPEWAEDPRFRDLSARLRHRRKLDEHIAAWTGGLEKIATMHNLQAAGVPATAVLNAKEMVLDPHLRARGYLQYIDQPGCGRRPYPRLLGAQFSAFATPAPGPAPTLGQHNREILGSLLGLSAAEVARLEADAVIGTEPVTPVGVDAELLQKARRIPLEGLIAQGSVLPLDPDYKAELGVE
jgi:crotonobetainyl-CoA:carnitine CoA-transferase CaiB-like acyl-CoA transferase